MPFDVSVRPRTDTPAEAAMSSIPGPAMSSIPGPAMSSIPGPDAAVATLDRELAPLSGR